ncbi:MAG: hypothetical protein WBP81_33775 [Solirubrobacteraceae bacterium]
MTALWALPGTLWLLIFLVAPVVVVLVVSFFTGTITGFSKAWTTDDYTTIFSSTSTYLDTFGKVARNSAIVGASALQTFTRVTLPIIWGGVFGAALFGFTLSWNEFERTLLVSPTNTLPLEIYGELTSATLQPNLYALGIITTFGTILLVFLMLVIVAVVVRRTTRAQVAALQAGTDVGTAPPIPALEGV